MRLLALLLALAIPALATADGPKDNLPDDVRPIPPKGVAVPETDTAELKAGLAELRGAIDAIPKTLGAKHPILNLLPDVEIYHKAVRYAVEYNEFFAVKDIASAKALLKTGLQRAKELAAGKPSWPEQTGYVVRGYRSKIDGSVQPYGLHVPKEYAGDGTAKHRLDFWWHGRGETLSEVNFMANQQNAGGIIQAPGAFILCPYGRYCNANKFAGEVDTFECLDHVKKHYRIDESRLVARGFSMGGAACWQYAVHFPTLWAAAAPGAGFSETPEFLNVFQNEKVEPTWYEKKLWHLYNATDYSLNLSNLPTIAYSGEIDRQKQAADVMAREMKKVGLELHHIIGPKTAHAYEKGAKAELNEKIDAIVAKGREEWPVQFRFITHTLRYNTGPGVKVETLEKHWEPAQIEGKRSAPGTKGAGITVKTKNVAAMTLSFPGPVDSVSYNIDGTPILLPAFKKPNEIHTVLFRKENGVWTAPFKPAPRDPAILAKVHGLQGPIDDAFFDRFLNVKPTGTPLSEKTGQWVNKEMSHAVDHWRKQFRGDAPTKDDKEVNEADIKNANLVLWGDPSSNAVLAKIADKLPVKWTKDGVVLGDKTYASDTHMPVLIFPNPLNPAKYMVLNSGFTFREYDQLNNARQVPKLPDYAIVDITTPANSRYPGKIVRAGFFGEKWELLPNDGE